ncbi:MAG: lipoate--protein ligase [Oscillospiraceae bacterium]|nr:lipoate--protein ligase [Oscillospiraceae bacterium]
MFILDFDATCAAESFAAEYYIAENLKPSEQVLYLWTTPPTVMIGKYQNAYAEINLAFTERNGIALARRMSGGGAIYTDRGCIQYSMIKKGAGEIDFYPFTEPVAGFLRSLGLDAAVSGRNDICVGGKKISGSAQYMTGGYTVHHGSLLFDCDKDALEGSLNFDTYKIESKGIKSNRERVTNIRELLSDEMRDRFTDAISFINALIPELSCNADILRFTDEQKKEIFIIASKMFLPHETVFGSSRKFNYTKSLRTSGGKITLSLSVENGIINDAELSGNFFASENFAKISRMFIGCLFDIGENSDIIIRIKNICSENMLYGVTESDLINLFNIKQV